MTQAQGPGRDLRVPARSFDAAVTYLARYGWSVIPIREGEKVPAVRWEPYQSRRPDDSELYQWWGNGSRYGVAVVTGALSGVVVLDVDGAAGGKALERKKIPRTVTALTARGHHYYFAHPGRPVRTRAGVLDHVDVRGDSGYVICPPSVHPSGAVYRWAPSCAPDDVPLAPLPAWVPDKADRPAVAAEVTAGGKIPAGRRNQALTSMAGAMRRQGMRPEAILAALRVENAARCEPPLGDEEVARIAGSVARYEPALPAETQSQRLGALSRSDALERIATHPPEWRVEGVLSTDDYGVLAGPKGVGKTFALEDLAVSVALGRPWFGRFPTQRARVLVMTSEDSEARLWRRADAIALSLEIDPKELDDWLFVHPRAFSAVKDLDRLRDELKAIQPGLAVLDPAYRYLNPAAAQLFEMGAVLTPLQEECAAEGTPLMVGHHYNRKSGARREERISGAGLLEWARLVITAEAPTRRAEDPDLVVTFEITGNSIDPLVFKVRRRVEALDDSPNPELRYSAEVISEGAEARVHEFATAADRVLAVLGQGESNRMTVKQVGDAVAHDDTGRGGLKHDTIRKALNRDLEGRVDSADVGRETFWWAVK